MDFEVRRRCCRVEMGVGGVRGVWREWMEDGLRAGLERWRLMWWVGWELGTVGEMVLWGNVGAGCWMLDET